ncbi:MAG: type III pantothenate kinase [Granulosicoccus sp.]
MRIVVDIGNSRFKSAIDDGAGLHSLNAFAWKDIFLHEVLKEVWLEALDGRIPESVIVSNVAGERLLPNLSAWCLTHFHIEPVAVRSAARFQGLINGYADPYSFGVDRWAAMVGARSEHSGALCVIDSGTATTVDLVDARGQHLGGAILPGIYTMRRSLGKYTDALFAADGEMNPFSDNTASGIAGGTGFASVGAMDRMVAEAKKQAGPVTTIVTGGESEILESLMASPVIRDPLLVLKGVSLLGTQRLERRAVSASISQELPVN